MAPTVGVVVPCKDEIGTIEACLRAIRAQVPAVRRIVVVDNGSTDGSLDVASRLADEVIELPHARIGQMRNAGAARCSDLDVLAFVDADCEVLPGWLAAGLRELESADLVGSRTYAEPGASWVARRWAAIEAAQQHAGSLAWSQHLAVRARTFALRAGGGRRALGHDRRRCLNCLINFGGSGRWACSCDSVDDMCVVHARGLWVDLGFFLRRVRRYKK